MSCLWYLHAQLLPRPTLSETRSLRVALAVQELGLELTELRVTASPVLGLKVCTHSLPRQTCVVLSEEPRL